MIKIFIRGEKEPLRNYDEALTFTGFETVISKDLSKAVQCDALLLPGGGDVSPARYGQEINGSYGIDEDRDADEVRLIQAFCEAHKPILGICRGLQIINVALGGTLHQDLKTSSTHRWEESTADKAHLITVAETGFLRPLYSERFPVNSAHHQGIDIVAPCLTATAWAEDGVIEAVENRKMGIYAVQWHPERMAFNHSRDDTVDGRKVFEFFFSLFT